MLKDLDTELPRHSLGSGTPVAKAFKTITDLVRLIGPTQVPPRRTDDNLHLHNGFAIFVRLSLELITYY